MSQANSFQTAGKEDQRISTLLLSFHLDMDQGHAGVGHVWGIDNIFKVVRPWQYMCKHTAARGIATFIIDNPSLQLNYLQQASQFMQTTTVP